MTADRDPQVAALLEVLEPEPPRPGFWVELEARLRAEPSPAVELRRVPGARSARRDLAARRRRVLIGVAAAIAVVAAVAGSLALRDDGRERGETVPITEPDDGSGPPITATPDQAATQDAQNAALAAADLWIRSIADGDIDGSWELLGSQSRDQLGSVDAFAEVVSDTAERFAPFAETPDRHEVVLPLGADTWVVVLLPFSEADAVAPALLVVRTPAASEASVEAFLPGPALGLIGVPSAGDQMVLPGGTVPLAIDADATVQVLIDLERDPGEAATDPRAPSQLVRDADGAITGIRLDEGLAHGLHTVAVAVRFPDGTFAVDSRVFEVGSLEG
jgi:hypothetical protein